MNIIKLNERELSKAGLPRDFIETMRHLVRQAGEITFQMTLPQVVGLAGTTESTLAGLTVTVSGMERDVADLESANAEPVPPDHSAARRLNELEAAIAQAMADQAALAKVTAELRDELIEALDAQGVLLNVRKALAAKAELAGSSLQPFATAALTTTTIASTSLASTTADATRTAYFSGAGGRIEIFGYYDATYGTIIQTRNAAGSAYVPLNIDALKTSFYAPNGVVVSHKLGFNGKLGEAIQAAPAPASDLPTSIAAINDVITRLTALGVYS